MLDEALEEFERTRSLTRIAVGLLRYLLPSEAPDYRVQSNRTEFFPIINTEDWPPTDDDLNGHATAGL
jgi:hypothetical protein